MRSQSFHFIWIGALFILGAPAKAYAGFNGFTRASRANCINNESISWDATRYHQLWTNSYHYRVSGGGWQYQHGLGTGWQWTWRSAAVHWGEGTNPLNFPWLVIGRHWEILPPGVIVEWPMTTATGCNAYDGWWG